MIKNKNKQRFFLTPSVWQKWRCGDETYIHKQRFFKFLYIIHVCLFVVFLIIVDKNKLTTNVITISSQNFGKRKKGKKLKKKLKQALRRLSIEENVKKKK